LNAPAFGLSLHPCTIGWRVAWPGLSQLAVDTGYQGAVIPGQQPLPVELPVHMPVPATAMQLPTEVRKDEATFASTFGRLREGCKFAEQVGCKIALLGIPPSSEQPRREQSRIYRERLQKCCAILDEYSIRLALECIRPLHMRRAHPYEFIWDNHEMLDFGLSVSPNTGLVVDAWHWHHGGSDPESIRGIPPDRILDVHISDSPPDPPEDIRDFERVLPGEGVVDFRLFFQLLDEKQYSGALVVEAFGGPIQQLTPVDAARTAFEKTRGMLSGIS
jgi:sugar phosphate isomerase/epimerase